jgi:hypothetical protein
MRAFIRARAAGPFLALLALAGASTRAGAISSGGMDVSRFGFDGGGQPLVGDGAGRTLSFVLSPGEAAGALENGPCGLNLGFYGDPGSGGSGSRGIAEIALLGGFCPSPDLDRLGDILLGMACDRAVCIDFDRMMLPDTVGPALRVSKVRSGSGASLDEAQTVSSAYLPESRLLRVAPAASWEPNTLYRVELDTLALDQDGQPIGSAVSFRFLTLSDPSAANTYVALEDTGTRLRLGPGLLPSSGYIEINADALAHPRRVSASVVESAVAKLKRNHGALSRVHAVREINFIESGGRSVPLSFPSGSAVLSIPLPDSDGDGFVDGCSPPSRVDLASLYYLDEANALWVPIPRSSVSGGIVSAPLPHLSLFAVITPEDTRVSEAFAYPVPFRPHGPNAGTGSGQTGTDAGGITFMNLPSRATVEVYNVVGERVWRGEENTGSGRLAWDTRNSSGRPAASGVYVFLIRNADGDFKSGKLAIIR